MVDLSKFKERAKSKGMSESQIYLMQKMDDMKREIMSYITRTLKFHNKRAGSLTTTGGAATEDFSLSGVKPSMCVHVQLSEEGATPVSIKTAKCENGKITVTFSADPGSDHKLTYIIC